METIKCVLNEMYGNIGEAREKIRSAYALKQNNREAAAWFRDMAEAHIRFNTDGSSVFKRLIEAYKGSEEYKRNPNYVSGIIDAWETMCAYLLAYTAEVRAMIESFE